MPVLADKTVAPAQSEDVLLLPPDLPELPDDVLKRFQSMGDWQDQWDQWWKTTRQKLSLVNQTNATVTNITYEANRTLRQTVGDLTVIIDDFMEATITAEEAIARRIISVSALASKSTNIKVQGSAPGGPAVNDIWVDNSSPATPITYYWSGAAWVEQTEPLAVAAVFDERSARITADGFLEGKYTLTVIAGNVVTGMNITSSTGGGTDVSSVIFRATDFQIYNGVTGKTMFSVSGTDVQLAGTLTVSTSGKVYIGTGTYGNSNTAWYVDSSGNFSLKDKLTWDGTTLTITGSISATTGSIGGFDVGTDYIRDAANSMGLASTVTGSDDVRFWAGSAFASRGSAPFRVTEAGSVTANDIAIIGTASGRSTITIASTINASGNVITDLINARLDTSAKTMLSDFTFGTADYSGALKTGTIAWNTTTGAITGGSGVLVYRGGIVGAVAGVTSFTINATTGAATFAGTLSAPSGTIGGWTIGVSAITGGNATLDSTGQLILGTGNDIIYASATDGTYRLWIGNATPGSAPFRVTKGGDVTASSATITGTISGRSTATIAGAIDASGYLITDLINARLDTSTKKMLAGFTFGTADYSGALSSGTITWNTTTGAITGGSGVLVYRGGIIGASSGTATFTIDAATGAATFAGALSAPTGNIGGWTIGSSTLTGGNATLSSTGVLVLGTSNDVVILSAADATYRLWVGNATAGSASFTVTKAGVLSATGATISGSITSTSGTIGGFTIGATKLEAGSGYNYIALNSTSGSGVQVGDGTVNRAFLDAGSQTGVFLAEVSGGTIGYVAIDDSNNSVTAYIGGGLSAGTQAITIYGFTSKITFGTSEDTNLYRSAANTLKTDDAFISVGGFTGNLTGNASGSSGSCSGNAATATVLQTARTIYGVSFNGSANIGQDLQTTATGIQFGGYGGSATAVLKLGVPDSTVGIHMKANGSGPFSYIEIIDNSSTLVFQAKEDGTFTCVTLVQTSSARFKSNIRDLRGGLDLLRRLAPRRYVRNAQDECGFVLEEVETVMPEMVAKNRDGTSLGLKYANMTAPIVSAVQELDVMFADFERRLVALEGLR